MKGILIAIGVLMAAAASAGPIEKVASVDSGTVIYYGHQPTAPFEFGMDGTAIYFRAPADSTFIAEGLDWVPWVLASPNTASAMDAAQRRTPDPMQAKVVTALKTGGDLNTEVLRASRMIQQTEGLTGRKLMERKAALYRASPLVDSARVSDEQTVLVWFKDLPSVYRDQEITGSVAAIPLAKRLQNRIDVDIVSVLTRGGMIIVDYGTEVAMSRCRAPAFKEELAAFRLGKPVEGSFIKDAALRHRFTTARTSLRAIVTGEGR